MSRTPINKLHLQLGRGLEQPGVPLRPAHTLPPFHAFHWPDHNIGKRESRRIREEHNALFNSHAELLDSLSEMVEMMDSGDEHGKGSPWHVKASAAVTKAKVSP